MNIKEAINLINENDEGVAFYLGKIPAKNKKTNKAYLESLVKLAYLLSISGENCHSLVDVLYEVSFENDYDYWTWIEYVIALKGVVSKRKGDEDTHKQSIKLIMQAVNSGNELQIQVKNNVHKRFLKGEKLYSDKVAYYLEQGDIISENNARLLYIMDLFKLILFGDELLTPVEDVEELLISNVEKLRRFILSDGLFNLSPFK
ncbi:hypothetical protein AV650_13885 [Serratia fonticola]|nr:hypothetical protein AV650_13885 [Serratia fonticola]